MIKFEEEMKNILSALDKSGMLSNCIISGSWAMYFYKNVFEGFEPPIATTDFDLFLPNVSKIQKNNISQLIVDLDYVRGDDCVSGKTVFYSKSGFEIEFLTLPNRDMTNVIKIKSINIGAQALAKMQPIMWNTITVDFESMSVNVPSPASYCLQKLLINSERKTDKQLKDIRAVEYVMSFVIASKKYSSEFVESFNSAPRKWQKAIKETIEKYNIKTPL